MLNIMTKKYIYKLNSSQKIKKLMKEWINKFYINKNLILLEYIFKNNNNIE